MSGDEHAEALRAKEEAWAAGDYSVLGARLAVVSELLRVCRPGGRIGLANWTLVGAGAAEDRALSRHFPPPGEPPPNLWITEEGLRELFDERVSSLRVEPRQVKYRFASMEAYVDAALETLGPLLKLVLGLEEEQRRRLRRDLAEALEPFDVSGDETLVLPFDYLEVVATKPA